MNEDLNEKVLMAFHSSFVIRHSLFEFRHFLSSQILRVANSKLFPAGSRK